MKLFVDTGSIKDIEAHRGARHPRRRHDESVAAGERARRLPREPQEDLRHRQAAPSAAR